MLTIRLRILFTSFLAVASISIASYATTEGPRVALVEPPANLLDAVSVALSPWSLRVVPVAATPPASNNVAAAKAEARALSQEHHAAVVLWISAPAGAEPSLWLYDAQTEQISVRPLPQAPPFDEPSAAAIALTVKTLLRSTAVAPPKERLATQPSALAPTTTTASSAPAPPASSPAPAALPVPSALDGATSSAGPPRSHAVRAEALIFARAPTGTSSSVAPRAGLSVSYWPHAWNERLGFGMGVKAGLNQEVSSAAFAGSLSDTSLHLDVRGLWEHEPFVLEGAVGPSLHVTQLSGAVVGSGATSSVLRGDPALSVAFSPQISVGSRLRLGLSLGTSILLRTQRYSVGPDMVLRLPPVGFDIGGRASLALD